MPNLRARLIEKMKAKKVVTAINIWEDSEEEKKIKFSILGSNLEILESVETYNPVFDSLGNLEKDFKEKKSIKKRNMQ